MSRNIPEALPGKLNIKRHSHSILYISARRFIMRSWSLACKLDIWSHSPSILYISPSLAIQQAFIKLDIKGHSPSILYISANPAIQQAFSKPCLVNLIFKGTRLVFSLSRQASRFNKRSQSLAWSTWYQRHSPSILYISATLAVSTSVLKALPGKLDIKRHSPSILYISASLVMSTSVLKALPGKLDI